MWMIVATNVRTVKTNTAGTATRASAQRRLIAPISSRPTADQYDAPRNTAVIGTGMVHANLVSVSRGKRKSCTPARNTSTAAKARSQRIAGTTGSPSSRRGSVGHGSQPIA